MVKAVGIDIGATLTKIAYGEGEHIITEMHMTDDMDKIVKDLEEMANKICLTGGFKKYEKLFSGFEKKEVDEFQAIFLGIKQLIGKRSENSLIVSIGTGTGFLKIEDGKIERIGGSALGGGTLMGLARLLTKEKDFNRIVQKAEKGDREKTDLLVKDIYPHGIKELDGSLTASSFGKATKGRKEDVIRSIMQMIGENIAIMSALYAKNHNLSEIFYIGTTVKDNDILRNVLQTTTKMLGEHGYFIPNGEYAGAIGAYLYSRDNL